MNIDIRLSLGFFDHPKTMKLIKRCGTDGIVSLQRLWIWAAEQRPNGKLVNMDSEDIELAAKWSGEDGKFVQALLDLHWLDEDAENRCYILHDWEEHQAYASKSDERSAKSKKAAEARWAKQQAINEQCSNDAPMKNEHAVSNAKPMLNDATSITEHAFSNAPKTNNQEPRILINTPLTPLKGDDVVSRASPYSQEFENFWHVYPKKAGKDAAWRAWQAKKREKRLPPVSKLIEKLEQFKQTDQWHKEGGQFIPNPSTWLNQARWQDEFSDISSGMTEDEQRALEIVRRANANANR